MNTHSPSSFSPSSHIHIHSLSNHRPSSVPQAFLFYPNLYKVSSAECVQLAAMYQRGGDKEQILITKMTTSLLQLPTWMPPLQVFLCYGSSGMSQRRRLSPSLL
ncbi:hypothetical protein QQF64_010365 [Cirrhinus molitorella]|uniref:Uncharacterized protein n=1 Tax=Cirrhinus molitorella TaxID=172907 RepID=A0ABR3M7V8_9TELE